MEESELIHRLRKGDEVAYRLVVDTYQSSVLNCCFRFVGQRETAEDLTQDVFIEVHRSIGSFRSQSKFSTWIYRIAVTKSLDHLKSIGRKKRFGFMRSIPSSDKSDDKLLPADPNDPLQILENSERRRVLLWAIDSLPENQKVAFTLGKFDELSSKEIAEILDSTVSAIESLIVRAKSNLRKKLYRYYKGSL